MKKKATILIADDEVWNRKTFQTFLSPLGYEILQAQNGAEALCLVAEKSPDIVLLDVMMPDMDGFTVCRQIKKDVRTAAIQVIMITVLTDRENTLKGIKAGANDFMKKPPDKEELCFRIRNALYTKRLFDIIKTRFQKINGAKTSGESLIEKSIPALKRYLDDVNGNMRFLYRQLEANLNSEQKDMFNHSLDSLQQTVGSLDGFLSPVLPGMPNQLEIQLG